MRNWYSFDRDELFASYRGENYYYQCRLYSDMADLVPAIILAVGVVALVKPGWIAAIDRRQRAAGTTRRSREVEMSDDYYAFVRIFGALLALVGGILFFGSLA